MYAYEDIGSDTIHQYLPNQTVETTLIHQGLGDGYYLHIGLGEYISGLLTQYLNPANLAILLLGAERLHIGLLIATYVKYVLICLFSLLFFLRLFKNEKAAMISALLWTFSSYNVLWGQHYHFLSAMVGFSACMYGFQLYLEEDKNWYIAVPTLALLVGCSYYFTYITAWFLIVYGVFYLVNQKKNYRVIFKKVGVFSLLALLTACICASYLVPSAISFLGSNRADQVGNALQTDGVFYPISTLLAFVARFLSTDLLGSSNAFTGPVNYYETAMLSVSFLFTYSVIFLLQSKYRWPVLVILVGCIIMLCSPLMSLFLVFTASAQRWTYLLCFLQSLTIGLAITHYSSQNTSRNALITILVGDGVLALLGAVLIFYHYHIGGGWLSKSGCMTVVAILLIYHIVFLLLWKNSKKIGLFVGLIAVELILGNYATINNRDPITVEQWYTQMYNDGTQNVVQWIQAQDNSIYRINKTYYSVYKTDSMVQGYNGMGSYNSTSSKHLIKLAKKWGDTEAGNWVGFSGTDWLLNDMLGVKYIISLSDDVPPAGTVEQIYNDGTYCVYQNLDWSGFGYLCQEEMAETSLSGLTRAQQALLLTKYYYLTENGTASSMKSIGSKEIDLLPYLTEEYDCHTQPHDTGIVISETGVDSQLYFDIPTSDGWQVAGIALEMDTEASSVVQIFVATEDTGYSAEQSTTVGYAAGSTSCMLESPVAKPVTLRLDPTMASGQTLTLRSIRLIMVDTELLAQKQIYQNQNSVSNLVQNGNTFSGTITNATDAEAMLCMPLIYSDFWKATLNGEEAEVVNINSGLVGIPIPAGTYSLDLSYDDTIYTIGKVISWGAIGLYFALLIYWKLRTKKS